MHTIVDGLGNPVEFLLSAGNDHNSIYTIELLERIEISGSSVLADQTYRVAAPIRIGVQVCVQPLQQQLTQ